MKLNETNLAVLEKAAEIGNVDITKATKIVDGFYKGLVHVIKTEQTIIKIPFFGKFIYSQAWKDKKEKIRLEYKQLTVVE